MVEVTDWKAWHAAYDDPTSSLSRRLTVVRARISHAVGRCEDPGQMTALSLCAGDGRDLLPVLAANHAFGAHVVLVENDPTLANAARRRASELALERVTVITGDAGETATYEHVLPVDLLLLCGIFGNVSEPDIRATVTAVPAMVRAGATVIWTRGRTDPDLRPAVRRWFSDAGLQEIAFESEPEAFGVGVAVRPAGAPSARRLRSRLFTFVR